MVKLNINSKKVLTFEIQVGGIQTNQIKSHLRFVLDEIEYGFPATIKDDCVTVEIPPLNKFVTDSLREGEKVEAKLEMIADGYYLEPWKDTFILSNPVTVEAKIKEKDENSNMEVSLISENEESSEPKKQKTTKKKKITESKKRKMDIEQLRENLTDDDIYKYMERAGTKNKKIQEIIYEQASAAASDASPFEILRQVVKILNKTQKGGLN